MSDCAKATYFTRAAAKRHGRKRFSQGATHGKLRAYHCDACGFWHLTSQDGWTRAQYSLMRSEGSPNNGG